MSPLSRRRLLRAAGLTALAFGAGPALSACAGSQARTPRGGPPLSAPAAGGANLNMRIWGAYPDFVGGVVEDFERTYGTTVDLGVIAGDYPSLMTNLLRQSTPLDMVYSLWHMPQAYYEAGWIRDFERFWARADAKREMLPAVRDALTVNGSLIGLPYFAFVNGALFANTDVLRRANLEGQYPTTYDELYAQVRLIKRRGASDTPYLPSFWSAPWYGIPFGFIQEALNRSIPLFADDGHPVFDEHSAVVDMLKQWRSLYSEGLVPKGVLTFQESDWTETFAKGGIAYSPQLQYDLKTFADPKTSRVAGKIVPVPQQGQNWGMLHVGAYLIGDHGQSDDVLAQTYDLAQHFGYRDRRTGRFDVPTAWAKNYYMTQGYAEVNNSPEVAEAVARWLPDPETNWPVLQDYLAKPQAATSLFHTTWGPTWMNYASHELPKAVNGDEDAETVVKNLRTKAESLIDVYGH
ncbi:ABC transporter substrate-binding protein [Amycolatopsis methanolica]|uniref:Extracellular solute-binding protein n=1 Tax=Amycolatopsis methanolica 239 TaxID=1068978 RepID=A0A076N061_AMYME|nr:ABC transporter substrate-binding protein [Amycolatopsis methanolica]AIJ23202.1 extracellular solute-binding protein [Amycolatopsis methanolica 239]